MTGPFTYKWVAGRSEFQGTGFRNPMDFAFGPDNSIYVVNRSYESRADGTPHQPGSCWMKTAPSTT